MTAFQEAEARLRGLVEDLIEHVGPADLREIAELTPTSSLQTWLFESLADLGRSERERFLVERLGMGEVLWRRLLRKEDLPPGRSAQEMASRWLRHRLPIAAIPPARPLLLAETLIEQAAQHAANPGAYQSSKLIVPEFERIVRWVVFFFLQALDDAEQEGLLSDRAERLGPLHFRGLGAGETVADWLSRAELGSLLQVLGALGDTVPAEPYCLVREAQPEGRRLLQLLAPGEARLLQRLVQLRNPVAHGRAAEAEAREFCEGLMSLLRAWTRREALPNGARAERVEPRTLGLAVELSDESSLPVPVCRVVHEFGRGQGAFVAAKPRRAEHHAERLRPLPSGPQWKDPPTF